jgi:hypothetical protein
MTRFAHRIVIAVAFMGCGVSAVGAQGTVSTAVRAELQARAGHYPLGDVKIFAHDSALLVFEDSSYTGSGRAAGTWMFGPPVTAAEADSCPPEKVLGRQIARILWRRGGKAADLSSVIVRVHGSAGLDRLSYTDMYYYPSQLEGPWAGDPEKGRAPR